MLKLIILSFLISNIFANDFLDYLNEKRKNASMIEFKENHLLNKAAYNHAKYLIKNNTQTHGQKKNRPYFTGRNSDERGFHVGYESFTSENLTVGNINTYESIDSLFTAIYHRFIFLNFKDDEVGIGSFSNDTLSASVFNLGDSNISKLCKQKSFERAGTYYRNICKDRSFRIQKDLYIKTKKINILNNPSLVVWPYENQKDFNPVFYEEVPDPLPECSVSGNPISIQFNPFKVGDIKLSSFKLFTSDNKEIKNVKVLSEKSDINKKFSDKEFALFPLRRLSWDTKYKVEFKYKEDGVSKIKKWSFKTKSLNYPLLEVSKDRQTFKIQSNKSYVLYFKPKNCQNTNQKYRYLYTSNMKINKKKFIDANTLLININGKENDILKVVLGNEKEVILKIEE